MKNDIYYMRRALDLATKAKGMTSPNPMVGCVVVKNNKIIAEGYHQKCGSDHAEIVALRKVSGKAEGATLYVTLEPCFHFGRTPPCVHEIISQRIKKVVIAMKDPNPLTNGQSIAFLRKNGIQVDVGVCEAEARDSNEIFVKFITRRMPFIVAKTAQTIDGKAALHNGESKWITSERTRQFARSIRDEFDAILVGINTVLKDDPQLNGIRKAKTLKKIIIDSSLKIKLRAKLFRGIDRSHCFIATTSKASKKAIIKMQNAGVHVLICPHKRQGVDLKWLFKELAKREISSILIEGGSEAIGSALKQGLVDKMHIYIAPKIIGDQAAISSVRGLNINRINNAICLKDAQIRRIGEDLLVTGYVHRNS